ncbi:hypothetical protein BUALT_Bualt05G0031100 [Buddleja alternifolia]|uniref:Uncharacterized protein n=1 Tax=Buddleja alternifolia TaxID=168488 RepID=A0AAV6XG06_9LAMI|nr:hypothetical protein BUALT_Bualt05G0031100 [Buddleja alternifolia]
MCASDPNSAIYVTDSAKDNIKNKMNRYAFSGGQHSIENHRKYGANLEVLQMETNFHPLSCTMYFKYIFPLLVNIIPNSLKFTSSSCSNMGLFRCSIYICL